jgi:hypothetical protein
MTLMLDAGPMMVGPTIEEIWPIAGPTKDNAPGPRHT